MNDAKHPDSRREFLALAAVGAATGFGALLPVSNAVAAAGEMPADIAEWLDSIPGKHRQVTDWPDLNSGMGLAYTFAFLMSAPAGYGCAPGDCGAVLVLRKTNRLRYGHVAVVKQVLNPRLINVTHSNWGSDGRSRRIIYDSMHAEDVSSANNWTSVRFWNYKNGTFGFPYAAHGFIYP